MQRIKKEKATKRNKITNSEKKINVKYRLSNFSLLSYANSFLFSCQTSKKVLLIFFFDDKITFSFHVKSVFLSSVLYLKDFNKVFFFQMDQRRSLSKSCPVLFLELVLLRQRNKTIFMQMVQLTIFFFQLLES